MRASPARVRQYMLTSTFSSTVIWLNSRWFWKVRATPSTVMRWGGNRVSSKRPDSITEPEEARWMPLITLNRVVLPDPFGPIMPTISPSSTLRSRPCRACKPPKSFDSLRTVRSEDTL